MMEGPDRPPTRPITVRVNGAAVRLDRPLTLAEALPLLGAPREGFAVERNGAIVPRSAHGETRLEEGDRLEIVSFVGGG